MLKIEKDIVNEKAIIRLEGHLDASSSFELEKEIDEVLESVTELVVDCEKLHYISSAGLRVLVSALNKVGGRDHMKIINDKRSKEKNKK